MVFGYRATRSPLNQFREEVDRLLTSVLGGRPDGPLSGVFRNQPAVNVWEQNDALKVEMELPGIKGEQLDISVAGGELSVKVNAPDDFKEDVTYHRRERPVGSFSRIVRLPVEVDADHVEADLHDGVLTLTLPKAEMRQAAEDQRHQHGNMKGAEKMENETTVTKPAADQPAVAERTRSGCCYRPNVDILEHGDELLVVADVPGARSDSIDVRFEDGMLEIQAAVPPREGDGHTTLLREYEVGDYYRSFQVSEAIDAGKISAQYADGVLTLHLPKAEALKPRKIAVAAK